MKDTRRSRAWTLFAVCVLAGTAGLASRGLAARRGAPAAPPAEELRDAVASPATPAVARLGGKPVPTTWFKTPDAKHADLDSALLASRRRRALAARRLAAQ